MKFSTRDVRLYYYQNRILSRKINCFCFLKFFPRLMSVRTFLRVRRGRGAKKKSSAIFLSTFWQFFDAFWLFETILKKYFKNKNLTLCMKFNNLYNLFIYYIIWNIYNILYNLPIEFESDFSEGLKKLLRLSDGVDFLLSVGVGV